MSIRREDYCCEQLDLVENYAAAKSENFKGWCIHHRLEIQPDGTRVSKQQLIDQNLYYGRPASELVFMRVPEHKRLHWIGNTFNKGKQLSSEHRLKLYESRKGKQLSSEHRRKLSEAHKGKHLLAETRQKITEALRGKHHSTETRWKISESSKGKHKSAETRRKMSEANKGKHWWNDGVSCKFSRECPGEGWTRGYLRFK